MGAPLLEAKEVSKSYFGVPALQKVSLACQPGEILGLVGANGAGKSTLIKILCGALKADDGFLQLSGRFLKSLDPFTAHRLGISVVHQEPILFENLTVAENLFINEEPKKFIGMLDWYVLNHQADEILNKFEVSLDPRKLVRDISVVERQLLQIVRAIKGSLKVLLLDEPTASLGKREVYWLFDHIRELVRDNSGVIYVSHRLDEVLELCHRIVVLRNGQIAGIVLAKEVDRDELIRLMVGREVTAVSLFSKKEKEEMLDSKKVILRCKNLRVGRVIQDVSFDVHEGEILGIAGLVGSGRSTLVRALYGLEKDVSGTILINGEECRLDTPADAISKGIAFVPEDRQSEGLFPGSTGIENMSISTLGKWQRCGIIDHKLERTKCEEVAEQLNIDHSRLYMEVQTLSGGNQQKIIMGRTLLQEPQILILDEPTRGVDVRTRSEIYNQIRKLATTGKGIILISSDWEELLLLSHRVIVLSEGRMVGELSPPISQETIMKYAIEGRSEKEKLSKGFPTVSIRKLFFPSNQILLLFGIILLASIGSIVSPTFRTLQNLSNLFGQAAALFIVSVGQMGAILSGEIDLSVGSLIAFVGVIVADYMRTGQLVYGLLIGLCLGVVVGLINGIIRVYAKVESFIITLGTMTILQGCALLYTRKPVGPVPAQFREIVGGQVGLIPYAALWVALTLVFAFILCRYLPIVRHACAVGENEVFAKHIGLNVRTIKIASLSFSGLMAAVAAIYLIGRTGAGDPFLGPGFELDSIVATLVGGTALGGGNASAIGTFLGVALLALIGNIMNMLGLQTWYQQVIKGIILILILVFSMTKRRS